MSPVQNRLAPGQEAFAVFVATGDRKFHGKSAVIDDDQSVVSTYNLDLLSGFVNGEVGAVVPVTDSWSAANSSSMRSCS